MAAFFRRLLGFVFKLDSGRVVRFCFLGERVLGRPFFRLKLVGAEWVKRRVLEVGGRVGWRQVERVFERVGKLTYQ